MNKPPLRVFETHNFKAIRSSGKVKFDWLTCFIGNNGAGKSSLIEALETFRDIVRKDFDPAMRRWRGFEHIWNKQPKRKLLDADRELPQYSDPMRFSLDWIWNGHSYKVSQSITQGPGGNSVFITEESYTHKSKSGTERMTRDARGKAEYDSDSPADKDGFREFLTKQKPLAPGVSFLAMEDMDDWQFLRLNPDVLGQPKAQTLATNRVRLATDGSNIAEYLNEIRELDLKAFEGILQSLSYVLPYAKDLQPDMTSELERTFYLNLSEGEFKVPGWLLSTGTLRIVSILACLRHPNPPPLLVIEEVENGLDPRTLKLVVEEIRAAIEAQKTQVIITTHSPFLLDLLDLSHVIVVDRVNGEPKFTRPDKDELASWSSSFSPGRLYTMGRLTKD